jgi:ATP-dependent exoDNAse (exonuclease V) beta subunit
MTLPPDQPVRARVLRDFDTTLLLEAGAGTGKTTVLVSPILALVRSGRAPVSTIHAFAAGLLCERPFEAGLDPGFQVAAEIAGERVLEDTWDACFDARMAEADPRLASFRRLREMP